MTENTETDPLDGFTDGETRIGRRRERKRTRRVLIAVLALVGLLGTGVVTAYVVLGQQIQRNIEWLADPFDAIPTRPPSPTPTDGSGAPVNILLLGTDSRISAGDPSQWRAGAQRTDAILLVHLPADRDGAFVMSIPRDSWVPVPGHGEAKINAAFSYGGPSLLIQTVEQLTGVHIDHFAVTDFEAFAALTDELGGVEITIPEDTYDRRRRETIPAGTYHMDGQEALDYVRQRYGLPGGDFDRVERHQNWIRAIAKSALTREVLTNPVTLTRLITTVSHSVSVDEDFTVAAMRDLALSLRDVRADDVTFLTAPVTGTGWSPDGTQSIVLLDDERMTLLSRAFADDAVGDFLAEHGDEYVRLGSTVR